jgi:transcriptional regulatory protein AMDR
LETQKSPVSILPRKGSDRSLRAARDTASASRSRQDDSPSGQSPSRAGETAANEEPEEPGNLCDFIAREEERAAEISLRGRSCYIGTEVSNFNYLVRNSSLLPGSRSVYHFRNRQFQRRHTAHDLDGIPREALERLDPTLEAELLQAYFARVNRGWPIVDEELFMEQYGGRDPKKPLVLPLLNAILLVGAHVLASYSRNDVRPLQAVFFRRAKALLDHRFEQDRTAHIQAALLLTWHSDGLEEVVANAWYWLGIATRTALGVGMHRDSARSRMTPASKRTWKRLWWVLFQFDTMISVSYGRPQAM